MNDPVDLLIIGQGICGSCLALHLMDQGKTLHLIDRGHKQATSRIAAGLINPITGRRYSKSWMIDRLLPYARSYYARLQHRFEERIYKESPIYRILSSASAMNYWDERSGDPEYNDYMSDERPELPFIKGRFEVGTVEGGMHVYMNRLIEGLRSKWIDRGTLTEDEFKHEQLDYSDGYWKYGELLAKKVVFCEGPAVQHNPYFNHLPWDFIKGEALYLKVEPGLLHAPVKQTLFLIPWEEDTLWVGTTYDREEADGQTSEEGKRYILDRLDERYDFEYELLDHFAANRPAVHDHRPIIGEHPEYSGLYIFNGMGTKAASLAPWFSSHFFSHLYRRASLLPVVDLNRF